MPGCGVCRFRRVRPGFCYRFQLGYNIIIIYYYYSYGKGRSSQPSSFRPSHFICLVSYFFLFPLTLSLLLNYTEYTRITPWALESLGRNRSSPPIIRITYQYSVKIPVNIPVIKSCSPNAWPCQHQMLFESRRYSNF